MALRKEENLGNGVTGDYWKIDCSEVNYLNGQSTFRLSLFKDESFKDTKSLGISIEFHTVLTEEEREDDPRIAGYAYIKSKKIPRLEGSIDV